ncbi:MAG: polymerase III, subunit gamma and tau protein [Parcubacteria group bacterium GW2011_GWF2_39_8b]|uniref:DNA polymerase III subunit gamma/tau n=2 Tax=Candidatus Zambryskiibacteriota TaxID=1817925 RepID=A0A1G2TA93_9BACT|nr:MAG: polymerase III, subunit gamma and tau protein [Parcubacteria group bacterium GW2011_GWF2_39_8b]KKR45642.1 MAG: polymerase III, subunit gamma and tau protein [Parcubacteria group bacterium GW2011_GWA2_40_14]OHA93541.1 MAG: DNA polymerase III, subunit gamma and tau [Candidatus Zambryskibacteria bacterium RIFCSPHIGHO2_02_38_10.5]OHA95272.1 MAG: DNA polymerase III, subunit gamma and tau [Candidatus Zambryskibacteria bacterium RIFCSPHIGHO2_02_FULL_39_82]OHA99360.1 MAG: DNA polymerase III, su
MSEVLYRKYRPSKFNDVIGQDHVVKVLEAEAKSGEISHAYLFAGTRGTGKTSVARIFASAIGTSRNDIYEIDAASNTSVEDIRTLNESVFTLPFESKYKVYILDEVHMLSKSASNALLKTLEEPPAHVVFILATTETHKIPETVLSRCEMYTFKKPSQEVLKKVVTNVAKQEGYNIDDISAELIALLGDGSFRDTLGIVQKVLAYSKGRKQPLEASSGRMTISEEEVCLVTGAPAIELVHEIISAIANKDLQLGLSSVKKAVSQNIDMSVFLKLILHTARAILLVRFGASSTIKDDLSEKEFSFVSDLAKNGDNFSSQTLIELLTAYENTKGAYIPSLPLELALVNIISQNKIT